MKTIRIAACDWLETEFSVLVVKVMPQRGKECRFINDGERMSDPFAPKSIGIARVETNTVLLVTSA